MEDIKDRIRELAEGAGLRVLYDDEDVLDPARCWVDGRVKCPYGNPEGQYVLRPEEFCTESCPTFAHNDLNIWREKEMEEGLAKDLRNHFDTYKVSVRTELAKCRSELPHNSPEREVLRLAEDVLTAHKMDRDILLEKDLPDEIAARQKAAELAKAPQPAAPPVAAPAQETHSDPAPPPNYPF